jgi:hypothetical protein
MVVLTAGMAVLFARPLPHRVRDQLHAVLEGSRDIP